MKLFKKVICCCLILGVSFSFSGCKEQQAENEVEKIANEEYDGRVFYEIFVRAFNDSNGDGIGDINGVTEKLEYLSELGVGGIWLMPISASQSYHGYDVIDYLEIDSEYGTEEDLKILIEEAYKLDIKIYTDMVVNHTSSKHKWFKEASERIESRYRDYYIWESDESKAKLMSEMGTIPWVKNEKTNDYYFAQFSSTMPELNLENEEVKKELFDIAKFYIDMGIDGFRMDAVKWYCEDIEATKSFLNEYKNYCKSLNKDFNLVGEVWDNTYAMAKYQNSLDSFFDFSLSQTLIKSLNSGVIEGLPERIKRNYKNYTKENEDFVVAPFLSNHDQARIINSLGHDEEKAKMAAAIYLTLPGTPFIYYGEEIGMTGSNPHEVIREPFIWSNKDIGKNTSWTEITNDIDKVALNIQKEDEKSLYNFYKDIITVRNNTKSIKFGDMDFIKSENKSVMIMKRFYENEKSYVIINASDKDININLEKGKFKVTYSNENRGEEIKIKRNIKLSGKEILILTKEVN